MKPLLLLIAIWLFIAPWPTGTPHLVEKITWILNGDPMKAIDWFDVVLHGIIPPLIIGGLVVNLVKTRKKTTEKTET